MQQLNTALPTENPEFVLHQTHVGIAGIDKSRGLRTILLLVLPNDGLPSVGYAYASSESF